MTEIKDTLKPPASNVGEYHPSRVNVGGQEIEISRKYKDTARLRFESPDHGRTASGCYCQHIRQCGHFPDGIKPRYLHYGNNEPEKATCHRET